MAEDYVCTRCRNKFEVEPIIEKLCDLGLKETVVQMAKQME